MFIYSQAMSGQKDFFQKMPQAKPAYKAEMDISPLFRPSPPEPFIQGSVVLWMACRDSLGQGLAFDALRTYGFPYSIWITWFNDGRFLFFPNNHARDHSWFELMATYSHFTGIHPVYNFYASLGGWSPAKRTIGIPGSSWMGGPVFLKPTEKCRGALSQASHPKQSYCNY